MMVDKQKDEKLKKATEEGDVAAAAAEEASEGQDSVQDSMKLLTTDQQKMNSR